MRKLIFLCFVLLLMALPTTARAQVTYDNAASSNCTVCSSLTYSLTVGSGSNRALAVWVFLSDNEQAGLGEYPPITNITYAGVSLIPITIHTNGDLLWGHDELWALPAGTQPTSGTNNVVVTLNGTGAMTSMHTGAISVAGVDQTQTFTSVQTNGIKDTYAAYMTLPLSGANDLVFDGVCAEYSVDSTSQTQRVLNNVDFTTACNNDGIATGAGGTVYLSWAVNGGASSPGRQAQMVGGSFHAAATATKLQLKSGKLQVVANAGTSTPAANFQWIQAQTATTNTTATTVQTPSFSSNPATGNTIICTTTIHQSGDAVTSVTDTQGNTYVQATSVNDATNVQDLELWYASNITGGSTFQVTATFASALTTGYDFLSCHEYAGLLPSSALDRTANGTSASATSIALGPVTTQYNRELVFYYFFNGGGSLGAAFCDWNDNVRAHTYYASSVCDFVQYTAGEVQPNMYLFGTGNPWDGVLATFRLNDAPLQVK